MGNTTNAQCTEHSLPESQLVAVGSLAFYSTLGVLGLFGNVHVIMVFASSREKSLRFLITVLSVMDLFISVIVLPTDCYRVYTDYLARREGLQPTNHWFSTLILSARYAAFEMEAWILVFIAVDRYLCIVKASQSGLSYRKAIGALIAAAVSLLLLEICNVTSHYLMENRCSLKIKLESYLLYFYGVLGTLSVLVVMTLYVRIFTFVASMERRRSSRHKVTERTLALLSRADVTNGDSDVIGGAGGGSVRGASSVVETTRLTSSSMGGKLASAPVLTDLAESKSMASLMPPVELRRVGAAAASASGSSSVAVDCPTTSNGVGAESQSNFSFGGGRGVGVAGSGGKEVNATASRARRQKQQDQRGNESWFPKKLAWMLFGATILFYGSMLPMILINFKLLPDSPLHRIFYLNTSLNFFVYAMMNSKFRTELRRIYTKGCRDQCPCCCQDQSHP